MQWLILNNGLIFSSLLKPHLIIMTISKNHNMLELFFCKNFNGDNFGFILTMKDIKQYFFTAMKEQQLVTT